MKKKQVTEGKALQERLDPFIRERNDESVYKGLRVCQGVSLTDRKFLRFWRCNERMCNQGRRNKFLKCNEHGAREVKNNFLN